MLFKQLFYKLDQITVDKKIHFYIILKFLTKCGFLNRKNMIKIVNILLMYIFFIK